MIPSLCLLIPVDWRDEQQLTRFILGFYPIPQIPKLHFSHHLDLRVFVVAPPTLPVGSDEMRNFRVHVQYYFISLLFPNRIV